MKKFLMILVALAMSACAAPADTSLILKPSAEQIKAAKAVGNKECPVTGEKIGSMGKGPLVVYKGKAVELCCSGCVKTFAKDPAKYLKVAEGSTADSVTAPAKADHSSHM
ncbi:MAG TPA: hypothetical protein PKY05_15865 [Fibrobacteria bacterium]|mgnify:FL=1|nr:hypothetical protein [Fibrobacteria bacterium]